MSRILICGSRDWNDFNSIKNYLQTLPKDSIIIHGGCRGADSIAGYLAKQMGMEVQVYKADWTTHGKVAGPKRNQKMLDEGKPNCVVAFHNDISNSKGTLDMVTRAEKNGLDVFVIESGLN